MRILTFTQWQNPESYKTFLAQPTTESTKTDKEATEAIIPTNAVTLIINKIQAPEGIIPALNSKKTLVHFDDIAVEAAGDKTKLIDSMEKFLPMTQMYPAPRSVILFQSKDSLSAQAR